MDFGGLISADVIKAKFKLEDIVQEALCENISSRKQCRDVNMQAIAFALEVASPEARGRYLTQGKKLGFGEDYVSPWGPGWEFSFGLFSIRKSLSAALILVLFRFVLQSS